MYPAGLKGLKFVQAVIFVQTLKLRATKTLASLHICASVVE